MGGKTETTELGYEGQGGWPGSRGREENAAQATEVGEGLARTWGARRCAVLGRQGRGGDPFHVARGAVSRPATASFHSHLVLGREGEVEEGTWQAQPSSPTGPPSPCSNRLDLRSDQIHTGLFLSLPLRVGARCHFPRETSQPLIRLSTSPCSQTDRSCSMNVFELWSPGSCGGQAFLTWCGTLPCVPGSKAATQRVRDLC